MWSYMSNNELENNNYYLVPLENVNDNLSLTSMTSILNENSLSNGSYDSNESTNFINFKFNSTDDAQVVFTLKQATDDLKNQTVLIKDNCASVKKRRVRSKFNSDQISVLESVFLKETKYPDSTRIELLAETLGLSFQTVTYWFQNKRAKRKRGTKTNV